MTGFNQSLFSQPHPKEQSKQQDFTATLDGLYWPILHRPDKADAKKMGRTGGDYWDVLVLRGQTIQQDLKSNNISINEATDMAQNFPHWRLMISQQDAAITQWDAGPTMQHSRPSSCFDCQQCRWCRSIGVSSLSVIHCHTQ